METNRTSNKGLLIIDHPNDPIPELYSKMYIYGYKTLKDCQLNKLPQPIII